ncbi:MAG TPA: SGNH/GDSL hydrolase family protein [Thermoanaerobaculia bacterium]|nr:SGNH/GDSL hydrolase family protein [Thermoanaerobaculia bacterium]
MANKAPRVARSICFCVFLVTTIAFASTADVERDGQHWIGTWAAAPQHWMPGRLLSFRNQTLRLIVHTSAGGTKVRIKISNTFGDQPLLIGRAHIARRAAGADIDPISDRALTFHGQPSATIAARSMVVSDPVDLDVSALSDLAVSLYFPDSALATTTHVLGLQTNYVSPETGDSTGDVKFPAGKTIASWPFLTGVDVAAAPEAAAIVAFGSSTTDGDGSTKDANRRWPDVLAERLQQCANPEARLGILNEGIIGNRLLADSHSPGQAGGPFGPVFEDLGPALGEAGVARFERDVLAQAGVKYVVLVLGINDILFPGSFTPVNQSVTAESLISGNRQLVARAHNKGIRVVVTTIPPFEGAVFRGPVITFYTPEKEAVRQKVNAWIRGGAEFDGVIDFDAVLHDPSHPTRLLPEYDSGDHLHANDAGYIASGNAISLTLFNCGKG